MGGWGTGRGVATVGGGGTGIDGAGAGGAVTDFGTTIFSGRPKKSMAPHATLAESTEARRKGESFITAEVLCHFFATEPSCGM